MEDDVKQTVAKVFEPPFWQHLQLSTDADKKQNYIYDPWHVQL